MLFCTFIFKQTTYFPVNFNLITVILAPYGISAELTGFGFEKKDGDLMVESEAWSTFYPLRPSHECDPSMSGVTGLPFFAMATPTHQNPRQQNRFSSDKKRTVEEINRRCLDTPPKFVEVIVGKLALKSVISISSHPQAM